MPNLPITYNLNGKDTTINFDFGQKASVFKYKICTAEGMKAESLEYYYKDVPMPDNKLLSEIFSGAAPNPKIKILAIGIVPKNKPIKDEKSKSKEKTNEKDVSIDEKLKTKSSYRVSVSHHISSDPKSFKTTEPTVMSTVIVENFPSRQELFEMVNKFMDEKKFPKDYKSRNKGSSIEFLFSNLDIAYEFIKYFNNEKFKNKLYTKSTANLVLETKQPRHKFDVSLIQHDDLKKRPKYHLFDYPPLSTLDVDGARSDSIPEITSKKINPKLTLKNANLSKSVDRLYAKPTHRQVHTNKVAQLYDETEDHPFINYQVPYFSQLDFEKKFQIHKKDKHTLEEIHGKKDFVPYVEYRRVLDMTHVNPALYDSSYNDKRSMYRLEEKEKWIDPDHDFRKAVKGRRKLY